MWKNNMKCKSMCFSERINRISPQMNLRYSTTNFFLHSMEHQTVSSFLHILLPFCISCVSIPTDTSANVWAWFLPMFADSQKAKWGHRGGNIVTLATVCVYLASMSVYHIGFNNVAVRQSSLHMVDLYSIAKGFMIF